MDKNALAVNVFDKRAKEYQEKYMDTSLYHDTFDLFCSYVEKKNAEILEIACGPGNITRYLLDRRPDFKILGTDLSPNMLELAKTNNPEAEFQLLDGRKISELDKKFDAILCGFGLPYLSKAESVALIGDAAQLLEPGGILYLSTMEDAYEKSGPVQSSYGDTSYIHYHQADYLSEALENHQFKILHLIRKQYPANEGSTTTDLVIIARR